MQPYLVNDTALFAHWVAAVCVGFLFSLGLGLAATLATKPISLLLDRSVHERTVTRHSTQYKAPTLLLVPHAPHKTSLPDVGKAVAGDDAASCSCGVVCVLVLCCVCACQRAIKQKSWKA
jgi:hypothetical protein